MQKLNCKPGDLAIVVNTTLPENLGQIVEVIGTKTKQGPDIKGPGHVWHVRTVSGRPTLLYRYNGAGGRIDKLAEGPAPDCRLRPVSGLDNGDAVQEDVAVRKTAPRRKRKPVEVG